MPIPVENVIKAIIEGLKPSDVGSLGSFRSAMNCVEIMVYTDRLVLLEPSFPASVTKFMGTIYCGNNRMGPA